MSIAPSVIMASASRPTSARPARSSVRWCFTSPNWTSIAPAEAREQVKAAFAKRPDVEIYLYPGCDHAFAAPERTSFNKPASLMAHSRSIALFRKVMGPHYDLSALWDRHTELEFGERDAEETMATMVAEPYVNHIPTMTGGVGYRDLLRFYANHFIPKTPQDTKLIPISRTIGADRIVDEMLFSFTHDIEIDWMLPGVAPTGKYVEVPLIAIVRFRGDKLYNEHIYWDQASVLVQIGLLDPALLPVAGVATAKKLVDETLPSNTLMARWAESAETSICLQSTAPVPGAVSFCGVNCHELFHDFSPYGSATGRRRRVASPPVFWRGRRKPPRRAR